MAEERGQIEVLSWSFGSVYDKGFVQVGMTVANPETDVSLTFEGYLQGPDKCKPIRDTIRAKSKRPRLLVLHIPSSCRFIETCGEVKSFFRGSGTIRPSANAETICTPRPRSFCLARNTLLRGGNHSRLEEE